MSMAQDFKIHTPPTPNFELGMGDIVTFSFRVERTLVNRLKWWIFCKVFPFWVVKWSE